MQIEHLQKMIESLELQVNSGKDLNNKIEVILINN